jgi:hypothetical protein
VDILGPDWLQRAVAPNSQHPLVREWMANGANAFLQLNRLAEDLRLITPVPRFGDILEDLRDGKRCLPAWHTVKIAAMFQRAGATVSEFYGHSGGKIPDFQLKIGSLKANVEAKLLTTSDVEEGFTTYAQLLLREITNKVLSDEAVYPIIKIILKSAEEPPPIGTVVDSVRGLLDTFGKELRAASFNVFAQSAPPTKSSLFRTIHVLCPCSEKENIRVLSRVKDAAHQLASDDASEYPGILWIGLSAYQDPLAVRNRLLSNFTQNKFGGISSVVLSLSGTHLEPPRRTVIDLWGTIKNQNCLHPLESPVPFQALDLAGALDRHFPADGGIPAYRACSAETRLTTGTEGVRLEDIRRIDSRWL